MAYNKSFDTIILGAGIMGSAIAREIAARGNNVLVIDQAYGKPRIGSSIGHTRLIRQAYFEHPNYVPLLKRARQQWIDLEAQSQKKLFLQNGVVMFGDPSHPVLQGVRSSARLHDLQIHEIAGDDLRKTYPNFRFAGNHIGLFEPDAGCLMSDNCLEMFTNEATRLGCAFEKDTAIDWRSEAGGIVVKCQGRTYNAGHLILAAGAWSPRLLKIPELSLTVRRVPLFWFGDAPPLRLSPRMPQDPCYAFALDEGFFYGVPSLESAGLKLGLHRGLQEVKDPTNLTQDIAPGDFEPVAGFMKKHMPVFAKNYSRVVICMYTMTRDEHFVLGAHPHAPHVSYISACSGHGFKFAPVLAEAMADLSLNGKTALPIDFLDLSRLAH